MQELLFPVAEFLPQVKVTDEMVKAYYDKNASLFQTPEQVKAEYMVLDAAAVAEPGHRHRCRSGESYYARTRSVTPRLNSAPPATS